MTLPLAHAGHWAIYVLYAVPVLIVLGSVVATAVRERRKHGSADSDRGSTK
jgi:hypothetical protein